MAILIGNKIYRIVSKKGSSRKGWIPADKVDLTTGLREMEALTLAAEEKRAAKPRTQVQRISDWLF